MLFSFNDEFIAAMCGGLNDADTLELVGDGIDAMIEEVELAMERTVGHKVDLYYDGEDIVAALDQEEADREFGTQNVMMDPAYRQGFAQSANKAGQVFTKELSRDA